ncbi:MAG: hypothetical protein ACKVJG_09650 [Candidatus Latescibacterota bacterium]|jgi:hypothetical protein
MKISASVPLEKAPAWAVLERQLISVMEEAVHPFLEKYTHPDGRLIWKEGIHESRDGADDFYESFYNWPLLYLLGGGDHLLELGQRQWDATTKLMEEIGHVYKEYEIGYDQFHQSESYIYFYLLCLADPKHDKNIDRARRFAGFFLNEDPEAINYDPDKKILRCAHNGSKGPRWLYEENDEPSYGYSPGMAVYGIPFEDLEGIDSIEDLKDPEKARRMGQAMKERMAHGDVATNLHVCSLITNAFLLTGDEKYKDWLLEYVDAWIERADQHDGFLPDNVGPSGIVGEHIDGKWYGSMYGWTWPHGLYNIAMAAILAGVECFLLTRDKKYLELPRNQLRKVIAEGKIADFDELHMSLEHHWAGQFKALGDKRVSWVVPYRYADSGWFDWQPLAPTYPLTLWNTSGDDTDLQMVETLRANETYDWSKVFSFHNKEDAGHEQPWFAYIKGDNPDYPEKILQASLAQVYKRMQQVREDETDPRDNHIHWWQQLNPVTTEALIQLTLGAPQLLYNGGLLLAPLRYFDAERQRPGLPPDIGALVETVSNDQIVLNLVNLSVLDGRQVLVQAGSLGEHNFTQVDYNKIVSEYPGEVSEYAAPGVETALETVRVDGVHLLVELPPGTEIRLVIGLQRHVNEVSYRLPW